MARFNKIFIGPVDEAKPQVRERKSAVALKPGRLVVETAGAWALGAVGTKGRVFIVQDNYLAMKGVDDDWTIGDTVIGINPLDEQIYAVRVPTGVNVTIDAELAPGANGEVKLAATTEMVVFHAAEAYNNTSGSSQLVRVRAAKSYIKP
jgi:hypothetical protein